MNNPSHQHQNPLKRSQKASTYYIPKLTKTSNMPKLEIASTSFDPDHQKRIYDENNDKENKNTANLPTRKANNIKKLNYINSIFKGIDVPNTTKNKYSTKAPTDLRGSQVNPPIQPLLDKGNFKSPSNAQTINHKQKMSHGDFAHDKYTFEARFSPIIREVNLTIQNNMNRYENYENINNINSMNTTPKILKPKLEDNNTQQENANIRRSMSLEDIRLIKKVSTIVENSQETSNKSSRVSVQRPDYAFSFNNKAGSFNQQQQQFELDQVENEIVSYGKFEENFIASLGGYIDYFDQSIEGLPSAKNEDPMGKPRKEREHKESYQTLLRQFRASNEEISSLKVQLDDIKNKKNELVATNNLIFREINSRKKKEQDMKERMENMEALIMDLKKEVNYYKLRFKEVQLQLQEERDGNKTDLLKLKKILSNNIDLAFGHGHKVHYEIDRTLERENPHRNSAKKLVNVYNMIDPQNINSSLDHKSALKYKNSYAKGGIGTMSTVLPHQYDLPRRIENKNLMKQHLQAPWASLNTVTPVSTEEIEEETSSRREVIRGVHDMRKDSEETKETEEMIGDEDDQDENSETVVESEAKTIQRLYQEGLEKEKHIKNLQKRLGELLLNNETKNIGLRLSHGSALQKLNNANYGIQRYAEQNVKKNFDYSSLHRRHASTFVEVPISEDINEYSFSLPNSE